MTHPSALLLASTALALALALPAAAQQIGTVEEVRQLAFATPPARPRAAVRVRYGVVPDELLETGRDSAVGVRFVDDTVLRLGPESQAALDRFVFDPAAPANQLVLSLARGSFRFISGRMPKDGVRLVTPTATIGIRGTNFIVLVGPVPGLAALAVGQTVIAVCDSQATISSGGTSAVLSAGQGAFVASTATAPALSGAVCDPGFMGARRIDAAIGDRPLPDPGAPDLVAPQVLTGPPLGGMPPPPPPPMPPPTPGGGGPPPILIQ